MSTTPQQTDRHRRRAAILDDPAFERFRSAVPRRRLALLVLAVIAIEVAVFVLAGLGVFPMWTFIGAMAFILVAFVLCLGALKATTRGVEELPEGTLDERHAQIRGRVYARAYTLVTWVAVALFTLVVVTVATGWQLPVVATLTLAVVAVQLVIIAPTLVAAMAHDA